MYTQPRMSLNQNSSGGGFNEEQKKHAPTGRQKVDVDTTAKQSKGSKESPLEFSFTDASSTSSNASGSNKSNLSSSWREDGKAQFDSNLKQPHSDNAEGQFHVSDSRVDWSQIKDSFEELIIMNDGKSTQNSNDMNPDEHLLLVKQFSGYLDSGGQTENEDINENNLVEEEITVHIPNDKGIIKYTKEFMLKMKEQCNDLDIETQIHLKSLCLYYSPLEVEEDNPNLTNEDLWDIPTSRTDQLSLSMWSAVETTTNETDIEEEKHRIQKLIEEEYQQMNAIGSDMSDPMTILQNLSIGDENNTFDRIESISSRLLGRDETRSRLHMDSSDESTLPAFFRTEERKENINDSTSESFDVSQIEKGLISDQVPKLSTGSNINDKVNAFFAASQNFYQQTSHNGQDVHQYIPNQMEGQGMHGASKYVDNSNQLISSQNQVSNIQTDFTNMQMGGYYLPNLPTGMENNFAHLHVPYQGMPNSHIHGQRNFHPIPDPSIQYPPNYMPMHPHMDIQQSPPPYMQQMINSQMQPYPPGGNGPSDTNSNPSRPSRRLIPAQMLKQQGATLHDLQKLKKQDDLSVREQQQPMVFDQKISPQVLFQTFMNQNVINEISNVNDKMENAVDLAEIEKMYK